MLTSHVHQCLIEQDPYDKDRHNVIKTVTKDFFNMSDESISDEIMKMSCLNT